MTNSRFGNVAEARASSTHSSSDLTMQVNVLNDLLPSQGIEWDVLFANGLRYFDQQGYAEHYDKFAYRYAKPLL